MERIRSPDRRKGCKRSREKSKENTMKKKVLARVLAALLIIGLLPLDLFGIKTKAAGEDEYVNPVLPSSAGVSFAPSRIISGPAANTVSIPGVPTVTATGLFNQDYIRVDGSPVDLGDGLGRRAYVKNLDAGNGWVYALGSLTWTDGVSRPIMYESGSGLTDGLSYYPTPISAYTAADGAVSYCMQSNFGSPGGITMEMVSDSSAMNTQISSTGKMRAQQIALNGYPLNKGYWSAKGIPEDAQRYATQVAIWCSLRNEPGNDATFYNTYIGSGRKYLTNIAVNGKVVDVLGMIQTLYNCGENGTNIYAEPTASVTSKGIRIDGSNYVSTFTASSTSDSGFVFKPSISGGSVQVNGKAVTPDASGWYTVSSSETATVTITYPTTATGTIRVVARPLDTRGRASLWWAQGNGHTGVEGSHAGNPVQDMLVIKAYPFNAPTRYGQDSQTLPSVSVTITKQDADAGTAQGDASLSGAVYGVYKTDGTLVQQFPATDASGRATVGSLLPGTGYYVQEISAPEGYQLSSEKYEFQVTSTDGMSNSVIPVALTVKDEVVKQPVQLSKLEQGTDDVFLPGAGFTFYLKKDVLAANGLTDFPLTEEGRIDLTGLTLPAATVIGANGETELFTGEDGTIMTEPIPYGDYLVVESTVPETYLAAGPLEISVGKEESFTEAVQQEVFDEAYTVILKLIKKDAEGNAIAQAGTGFQIYDAAGQPVVLTEEKDGVPVEVSTFYTDETGTAILPGALRCGTYYIKEVQAPFGYALDETLIPVEIKKGSVAVYEGEAVLSSSWDGSHHENTAEIPVYDKPITVTVQKTDIATGAGANELSGATLTILAKEAIYDNSGTLWKDAGEVVDRWISEAGNHHVMEQLPAGDYILTEETAPFGYSVAESVEFSVSASGEIQSVVMADGKSLGKLVLHKYQEEKLPHMEKKPIKGTEFTLFYGADVLDAEGNVVHAAGDVALDAEGKAVILKTDENGYAEHGNIPIGTYKGDGSFNTYIEYVLRETKETTGYLKSDTETPVVFEWKEEETGEIQKEVTFTNDYTKVEFVKTDSISGDHLSGGFFEIQDMDGNAIHSFSASEDGVLIEAVLAPGTYRLVEKEAPEHFQMGDPVIFTVEETGLLQTVVMEDEPKIGYITVGTPGSRKTPEVILGAGGKKFLVGSGCILVGIAVLGFSMKGFRKKKEETK